MSKKTTDFQRLCNLSGLDFQTLKSDFEAGSFDESFQKMLGFLDDLKAIEDTEIDPMVVPPVQRILGVPSRTHREVPETIGRIDKRNYQSKD